MDIKIYTLTGCHYCVKIKELLKRAKVEYTELLAGRDFTVEDFRKQFPTASGYPIMTVDEEYIGGVTESVKFFVDNGMVSSKK